MIDGLGIGMGMTGVGVLRYMIRLVAEGHNCCMQRLEY